MNDMRDEAELLRRYALEHDNEAFSELVHRTIDFVYATALRQCRGNAVLAQDVTQLVFTDLSRCAKKLVSHPALAGWLHTATRFAAMKVLRTESRRLLREQRAAELQSLVTSETPPTDWTQLQPIFDETLGELKERDRAAILLRFFQGKSLGEVGASLQLSETAARSCVDRALDRLRSRLARRGVTSTSAALSLALAQQVATAAPAGLAAAVSGTALAQSAAGGAALIPLFAMNKIIVTTVVLALVAELATATVELKTKRSLEADYRRIESDERSASTTTPSASSTAVIPATPSAEIISANAAAETARLERRLTQLKARPPGVSDAKMTSPRAMGRDTPVDAIQTLTAALRDRDMGTLDQFVRFSDDSPENRTAFMAKFSDAIRARYQTPERMMVAFSFAEVLRDSPVAQQLIATHGYSGGVQTVTTWTRLASGLERQDTIPFEKTPNGWTLSALRLSGGGNSIPLALMVARIDPVTGDVLPAKKN